MTDSKYEVKFDLYDVSIKIISIIAGFAIGFITLYVIQSTI